MRTKYSKLLIKQLKMHARKCDQIVTDNASKNMTVTNIMQLKKPSIFWTFYAAHTVNLMLCDNASNNSGWNLKEIKIELNKFVKSSLSSSSLELSKLLSLLLNYS